VKRWAGYAAAGLALTLVGGWVGAALVGVAGRPGVWFAAALSYGVQLVAFAALLAVRGRPQLFMVGWLSGMVLRFGVVGLVAFWLARTEALPPEVTLVSLVTFVVLLLFLEPWFLGRAGPAGTGRGPADGTVS
jgi:hypothetical protein